MPLTGARARQRRVAAGQQPLAAVTRRCGNRLYGFSILLFYFTGSGRHGRQAGIGVADTFARARK
jgi:hypothetical protein